MARVGPPAGRHPQGGRRPARFPGRVGGHPPAQGQGGEVPAPLPPPEQREQGGRGQGQGGAGHGGHSGFGAVVTLIFAVVIR